MTLQICNAFSNAKIRLRVMTDEAAWYYRFNSSIWH